MIPDLISFNQSTFISELSIINNILMSHEFLRGFESSVLSPRCCLKIDLKEVFDSFNWQPIFYALDRMGFSPTYVKWIEVYVPTASFSIQVNGQIKRYFQGTCGIHQGDLLGPYLFLLMWKCSPLL